MTYLQQTREAIAAYDAKKPEREALWQAVVDNDTFQAANKRANADVAEVQTAFHRDTKGYNCLSDCMKVTVPEVRALIVRMDARWAAANSLELLLANRVQKDTPCTWSEAIAIARNIIADKKVTA